MVWSSAFRRSGGLEAFPGRLKAELQTNPPNQSVGVRTPRWTRRKFFRPTVAPMPPLNAELLAKAKGLGFSDRQIAHLTGTTEDKIRALRKKLGLVPSYRLVDTCAAEFEAYTPYYYSTYDRGDDEVKSNSEEEGDDSRRRAEPHRAGDRIRLLLRPCRVRAQFRPFPHHIRGGPQ